MIDKYLDNVPSDIRRMITKYRLERDSKYIWLMRVEVVSPEGITHGYIKEFSLEEMQNSDNLDELLSEYYSELKYLAKKEISASAQ